MAFEPDNDIQQAFQDGIEEVFSTLLCNHVFMAFLDNENTETNIYDETPVKVYKEPYELIAKVTYSHPKGVSPEETVIRKCSVKVPTKQFTTLGIPFLSETDWEEMRKAKLTYEGVDYLVDTVTPSTLVADLWQFFEFECTEDKKRSIR